VDVFSTRRKWFQFLLEKWVAPFSFYKKEKRGFLFSIFLFFYFFFLFFCLFTMIHLNAPRKASLDAAERYTRAHDASLKRELLSGFRMVVFRIRIVRFSGDGLFRAYKGIF